MPTCMAYLIKIATKRSKEQALVIVINLAPAILRILVISPNFTTTISGPLTSFHSFANHCGWQKINAAWYRTSKLRKCWWILLDINFTIQKTNVISPMIFLIIQTNSSTSLSIKSGFLTGLFNGETLTMPRGKPRRFTKSGALGRCCSAVGMIATPIFRSPQLTLNNILGKLFR